jgi:hypothetical protein
MQDLGSPPDEIMGDMPEGLVRCLPLLVPRVVLTSV